LTVRIRFSDRTATCYKRLFTDLASSSFCC
jgi:hypothetical protein